MDYNAKGRNRTQGRLDLLDLLPESSVDVRKESHPNSETVKKLPARKSNKRINSDVVTVKSSSGDIAFAAVGRRVEKQRLQSESAPHAKQKQKNAKTRCHSIAENKNGADSSPQPPICRGDNLSCPMTSSTGDESLALKAARRGNSAHLQRWINGEFSKTDHTSADQRHHVANDDARAQKVRKNASRQPGSTGRLLTSRSPSATSGQSLPPEESESSSLNVRNETASESRDSESIQSTMAEHLLLLCCKACGQEHGFAENHEYNYIEEVDEDLMCDICLQPLVDPFDTKCGHTFCSICIKNYLRVQKICPVDRVDLTNVSRDCWQSSLVLRKLVSKLMVSCPHEKLCNKTVQRCDLKDHLQDVCPGTVVKCPKSMYGCLHKTARVNLTRHLVDCKFKDLTDKLSDLYPFSDDVTVELFRPEGTAELGIMIVGGRDTPLPHIKIQGVLKDSLVEQDGRLHVGDIIVEVNSESLISVTHTEARVALSKPSSLMRFTLLRPVSTNETKKDCKNSLTHNKGSVTRSSTESVRLVKPTSKQLGIRLASGDKGVFITKLFPGQLAQTDGRLRVGDQILQIGETDLRNATPDEAAIVISNCNREINIVVRHMHESAKDLPNHCENAAPTKANGSDLNNPITLRSPCCLQINSSHARKKITVTKLPTDYLGITVGGGKATNIGHIPIFVKDIVPSSALGKDSRIKRGDLLLEINTTKLTGLTHNQAVSVLREAAQQRDVTIIAYEFDYDGKAEDEKLWNELIFPYQDPKNWLPSWKMWLSVTKQFSITREIVLRKSTVGDYLFKISGGPSERSGIFPIFVTEVPQSFPAAKQLKCGDEILAINKRLVKDVPYSQLLSLLRASDSISLKIVSWPGSLH